jgi:hypothetical protein
MWASRSGFAWVGHALRRGTSDALDQLLAGSDPTTAYDPQGLLDQLKKALAERALDAELEHHFPTEAAPGQQPQRLWLQDCDHR